VFAIKDDGLFDGGLLRRLGLTKPKPHDVAPVISFDESAARSALTSQLSGFTKVARDATVELASPEPTLSEKLDASFAATATGVQIESAINGQRVDVDDALKKLRAAVDAGQVTITLPLITVEPKMTTAMVSQVDQLIGTFTTMHPCCAPRVTNIHRIAKIIDGSVIAPGATFSLNQASGPRTQDRGFVNAPAIAEGELVQQVGGGSHSSPPRCSTPPGSPA
jgi:vancomycin resistance protein YoaR